MKRNLLLTAFVCTAIFSQAIAQDFKVGDKVEAGIGSWHNATIVEVSPKKLSYRMHFDDNAYPDNEWLASWYIRARDTQAKADAAAAKGPRLGKYLIYIYMQGNGTYYGYFTLNTENNYEVFSIGSKPIGKGNYAFNSITKRVRWNSGPFADKGWDGTQQFEVSREGKTHIIRLKSNTIGTNSTDSKP